MNSDCLLFCRIFELVLPKYAAHSLEKYFGYRLRQIQRPGSITTREALSWINQIDNQPFFVLVHYFDVHGPHVKPSEKRLHVPPSLMWIRKLAPEEREKAFTNASEAYDEQISYADRQVGNLVAQLKKLSRKVIVIFTADHGESLTEHGFYFDHGEFLYETCVQVPMMIRFPDGSFADSRITTQVSLIDLAPTILELAGGKSLPSMVGKSLFRILDGSDSSKERFGDLLIGKGSALSARYFVRSGGFKLIWNYDFRLAHHYEMPQSEELYDLKKDPDEKENRIGTLPEIQTELGAKLKQFLLRDSKMRTRPDNHVIEQLKALGYTN